jgi:alpha-mannosidase
MFLVGNYRERPPLESETPPGTVIDVTLPPFSYQVVPYHELDAPTGATAIDGCIENRWYRVRIDLQTGGLLSWFDKELERELVDQENVWRFGQYVYEWIDHPDDRRALFALDFDREDFGVRFTDTPFRREGPIRVELLPARVDAEGVQIEAQLQAAGAHSIKVRYVLPHHEKSLQIDMMVDKTFVTRAEAVYIPFPIALDNPTFHLDLNGVPLEPEVEQLPGSCRDWYGIHRWAEVGNDEVSVTLAPLDSPLIQVGGITTGRWAHRLDTSQATLVSWALHNHWDTNFKASQGEDLLLRYRLTSSAGYDPAASSRFAMEASVPPLIVRVPGAQTGASGQLLDVSPQGVAEVQLKRAADGRGLIVHAYNLTEDKQIIALRFMAQQTTQAWRCSPIEEDLENLIVDEGIVSLEIPPRSVACGRIIFA